MATAVPIPVPGAGVARTAFSFNGRNPEAVAWAEAYSARLVRQVSDETRQAIKAVMARAFQERIPPREAARLLNGVIGLDSRRAGAVMSFRSAQLAAGVTGPALEKAVARYAAKQLRDRAMTIARTETMYALNGGAYQAYGQAIKSGRLSNAVKTWITTPDERLCPICGALSDVTVPFGDAFPGGFQHPPAHPRCRCTFTVKTPKSGREAAATRRRSVRAGGGAASQPLDTQLYLNAPDHDDILIADGWEQQSIDEFRSLRDWAAPHGVRVDPPSLKGLQQKLLTDGKDSWRGRSHSGTHQAMTLINSRFRTAMRLVRQDLDIMVQNGLPLAPVDASGVMFPYNPTTGKSPWARWVRVVFDDEYADGAYAWANSSTAKITLNMRQPVYNSWADWTREKANNLAVGWSATENTFIHEVGHSLHLVSGEGATLRYAGHLDDWGKFAKAVKKGAIKYSGPDGSILSGRVSRYATRNPKEFVAETWAGMNKGIVYDDEVMALYRAAGGEFPRAELVVSPTKLPPPAPKPAPPPPPPAPPPIPPTPPIPPVPPPTPRPSWLMNSAPVPGKPVPPGPRGDVIRQVVEFRKQGLGYHEIEVKWGKSQNGAWAFKIIKTYGGSLI